MKTAILDSLQRFIWQRPGIRSANYAGHPRLYAANSRRATRDLHDGLALLAYVRQVPEITAEALLRAMQVAYSGRLSWSPENGVRYITGQYWPTEYRAAVCAVLAAAIRGYWATALPSADPARVFGRRAAKRFF